ncbi:hypothetical protein MRX96_057835, partial [Rhipicephalus microplus]
MVEKQPGVKELEEQKRKSEEAGKAGFAGSALLATKASASAERLVAFAIVFRPGGSDSSSSTDSSPKTDTSGIGFVVDIERTRLTSALETRKVRPSKKGHESRSKSAIEGDPKPGPSVDTKL